MIRYTTEPRSIPMSIELEPRESPSTAIIMVMPIGTAAAITGGYQNLK